MSTDYRRKGNKVLSVILTLVVAFSVFFVLPAMESNKVHAVGEKATVITDVLNVRSGAGTGYSKIGTLQKGDTFIVKGSTRDKAGTKWYKFDYRTRAGYVSAEYVNIKQNSVISLTGTTGIVKEGPLNVRKGPGTSYSSLGSMAKGKTFNITGKIQSSEGAWWYRLSYNGKTGYVHSKYITIKTTSSTVVKVLKNTKGTVKSTSVNVRRGPGVAFDTLGKLTKGKTFTITGKIKDNGGTWWYRFTYNGKTAYVHSGYITISVDSSSDYTVTSVTNTRGTVSEGPLNVRKGPGTSYAKLGSIAEGKTFAVTGKAKDKNGDYWYRLTYSGKTGFVHSDYVTTRKTDNDGNYKPVTFKTGTVTTSDGLNVRSGAGTNYSVLTILSYGDIITITGSTKDSRGNTWYKYKYSSTRTGYVIADYIKVRTITSNSDFEKYLTEQGFPESYKPGLRALHAQHPKWIFKAKKVGYSWSGAISKESVVGRNLVDPSLPSSYRSKAPGAYNSKTGAYTRFDGRWYSASPTVIKHYMDPRNFLNNNGIYQFMTHKYDGNSQNSATVKAVISGSFMAGKNPAGSYSSYQSLISAAGKAAKVNPNVLAAMIIQEQGWSGSSLVSGTYSGYRGYYNFFNIGAYTTSSMSAVERGLWYAKRQGWNTPYKSIVGGVEFYADEYVNRNQDSYYTKKFNVKNGYSNVGTHQYMTNVSGAYSEGALVKGAYNSNSDYPIVFELPVYNSMPSTACPLP